MLLADAYREAVRLKNLHGLFEWKVIFFTSKVVFGYCGFERKVLALSAPTVKINTKAEVVDTILHEIAHAVCGLEEMHGEKWKRVCKEIGCSGTIEAPTAKSPRNDKFYYKVICTQCKQAWIVVKKKRYKCIDCGDDTECKLEAVYGTRNELIDKLEEK